jgi:hypothetical protein
MPRSRQGQPSARGSASAATKIVAEIRITRRVFFG